MIQDHLRATLSEEKTKNFYLSEEAGLTPLLAMTQSLKTVIGWLSKKEVRALLRVGFIIRVNPISLSYPFPFPYPPRLTPSPCPSKPSGKR